MYIILFFVLHWYLSLFCQSFFLHRYGAHRMFTMNKFWERFFFILTYITQGASFLNPRTYSVMHRMHHAYSDKLKDPHSPHNTSGIFRMMWRTRLFYVRVLNYQMKPKPVFTKNFPEWASLENFAEGWASRILFIIMYACLYIWLAPNAWFWLLFPLQLIIGPLQGAIVNWSGHKYGYQSFNNGDKSRNTLPLDILLLGELFQNNHHKFPLRANFAVRWFEFDPLYPVIRMLSWMKVIRFNRKQVAVQTENLSF